MARIGHKRRRIAGARTGHLGEDRQPRYLAAGLDDLAHARSPPGSQVELELDAPLQPLERGLVRRGYAEGTPGEVFGILGSMGFLEVAANRGSAFGRKDQHVVAGFEGVDGCPTDILRVQARQSGHVEGVGHDDPFEAHFFFEQSGHNCT